MEGNADINVPWALYLTAYSQEQRDEVEFKVSYSKGIEKKDLISGTPLESRPFGLVKELEALYSEGKAEELVDRIFSMEGWEAEKVNTAPAWKVLASIEGIFEKIGSLIKIEDELLRPSVDEGKYRQEAEQVDFSMFTGEYIQLRDLAGGDLTKFDAVKSLPYEKCLVELVYRQKQSDFEKLIAKRRK